MKPWHGLTPMISVLFLVGVACSPLGAPAPTGTGGAQLTGKPAGPPLAKPDGSWDDVLAAARKEGKVVVAGPPGTSYRDAMRVFEQRFPDIRLEFQGLNPVDFVVRFQKEHEAGQFLWDVYITGPTSFDLTAKRAGEIVPIRTVLLLPEVTDEAIWFGGFEEAYLDREKQYVFAFQAEVSPQVYINRDFIRENELSTVKGLLDPKWKGKIAIHDPRMDGAGNGRIASWLGQLGEDFVRALLRQDVGLTRDSRQLAEWVVRGQYPIAIGLSPTDLLEFTRAGVEHKVVPLGSRTEPEAWRLSTAFGAVRLLDGAPDPNAATVFINWLLSKEGQTAWVEKTGRPSRRLDVPRLEDTSPIPGVSYFDIDREERLELRDQAKRIAEEILR
ncbi:MAG TPA: extracellular solute-binding protein [Chloroflexota bacterium]|nr:extracellular solute-binding protein [Chloroflexota bacterium]